MPEPTFDPDDGGPPCCPVCGSYMDWEHCWTGCDDGWVDEADEDAVNFAPGQEYRPCEECLGAGGYWACERLPHTEEQLAAYRARRAAGDSSTKGD